MIINHRAKRYEDVPRTYVRKTSNPASNMDLAWDVTYMDDCVAAVAAYRRLMQRIENIDKLALVLGLLDEDDQNAIMSQDEMTTYL